MIKMTEGLLKPEDLLKEIIKLQLKKPKRWNWELSTSKSSPHICLPIIQLFDSKGKLLVEARDTGGNGATWHSAQMQTSCVVNPNRGVRRCGSDNFSKKAQPVPNKEIKEIRKSQQQPGKLRKSNSDVWNTRPSATPADAERRDKPRAVRQYKRTRSDDVYKRMLKQTDSDRINENYIAREDAKYETRTCNAGTIIVKRDSLDLATIRRRRRGRHGADDRGRPTATAAAADRYKSVEQPYAVNRRAKGLSIPEKFDNDDDYVVEEPPDSDCHDKRPEERAYCPTSSGTADSLRRELKGNMIYMISPPFFSLLYLGHTIDSSHFPCI